MCVVFLRLCVYFRSLSSRFWQFYRVNLSLCGHFGSLCCNFESLPSHLESFPSHFWFSFQLFWVFTSDSASLSSHFASLSSLFGISFFFFFYLFGHVFPVVSHFCLLLAIEVCVLDSELSRLCSLQTGRWSSFLPWAELRVSRMLAVCR